MTELEKYYNKFNEDHRLTTRHGIVEFTTTMKYIHQAAENFAAPKILDVGAGTGRYSLALCKEGFDVTAVELVKRNLDVLRSKHENVKTWQGNATNLYLLDDSSFDITLVFGPMYHLHSQEERIIAMQEAIRVTKPNGIVLAVYMMNEYAVLSYCFGENKLFECLDRKSLAEDWHSVTLETDLYSYLRLEDINYINQKTGLKRIKIVSQDGPSDYMRRQLNAMDEKTFQKFIEFHLATCERPELLGAGSHCLDILHITKTVL